VVLTVNKLPDIITEETIYYCLNTFPQNIILDASLLNDYPTNYNYSWSTNETSYEIEINQTGIFTVDVIHKITNCSNKRTIFVEASNIAELQSIDVVDASQDNKVIVFVSGEGVYEYALFDSNDKVYLDFQLSNSFENVFPGIYSIRVKDVKNNCGMINKQISVIGFPKFFTPNNDGVHDTWQVLGVSSMFQANSKILIFNRYGKLLKQLTPLAKGWDGSLNGKKLPTDDYWFAVTLKDGRIFKGHFTLKN
jgi:gliding motility-associated-like protein